MISVPERTKAQGEGERKSFDNFDFNLRCASPGIIQSFDATAQTVVVKIAIKERVKCDAESFIAKYGSNVADIEIPLLLDVPICIPCVGDFSITLPVKAGDECLVIFTDTCIDAWWQSGGVQKQMSLRRHDLSDSFAILGVKSQPQKLTGYSTDSLQIRNKDGDKYIELSESAINLILSSTVKVNMTSSKIDITAPAVNLIGNVAITGNITNVTGTALFTGKATFVESSSINGKDFITHVHNGVETGVDNTGGVVA